MRIFFTGYHNPRFACFAEYFERAIKRSGHVLDAFDFRDWLIPGRIRQRLPGLQSWDIKRINDSLVRRVEKFKPDLFIINGGWTISAETLFKIRKISGAVMVNWTSDFPLMFKENMMKAACFDHFFTSGTDALKKYMEAGNDNGHWLPFACCPEIHKPVILTEEERKRYGCDICFVGSYYPERLGILEALSDFDLGIWGIGWERLPKNSPLRPLIRGGIVRPEEWVKIFSASKIILNINPRRALIPDPDVQRMDNEDFRMCNMRVFEILGCGAFQLVDARADVLSLFGDGKHLALFKDAVDAARQARFYLNNPELTKKIAETGRREVLSKHTYRHRLDAMLSIAGKEG